MTARRAPRGAIGWDDLVVYPQPGLLTLAWRWRTELSLAAAGGAIGYLLVRLVGGPAAMVLTLTAAGLLVVLPGTRRRIGARAACVLSRHRLYVVFREIRATSRNGRLPLVLRVSPTPAGERAVLWCRAGVVAGDLAAHLEELRTGCWVPDVRVSVSARWPQLVTLELVRQPAGRRGRLPVAEVPGRELLRLGSDVRAAPAGPSWPRGRRGPRPGPASRRSARPARRGPEPTPPGPPAHGG